MQVLAFGCEALRAAAALGRRRACGVPRWSYSSLLAELAGGIELLGLTPLVAGEPSLSVWCWV